MLIGQERAGKTSLKKSLKGEEFDPKEPPTKGIEVTKELLKAEETRFVEAEMLVSGVSVEPGDVEAVLMGLGESGENRKWDGFNGNTVKAADNKLSQDTQHTSQQKEPSLPLQGTESEIDSDEKSVVSETVSNKNPVNPVPETGNNTEQMSVEVRAMIGDLKMTDLKDDHKIYCTIWDFAGQSVYYATHRIFLTYCAIYLLVHNLSLDPNGVPDNLIREGWFEIVKEKSFVKTNYDFLHYWMTSIASVADSEKSGGSSLPQAIFVCTHADEPFEGKPSASEMFGSLIRTAEFTNHLVKEHYVVDNSLSGEDAAVKALMETITKTASNFSKFSHSIPHKWYKFELALKEAAKKGFNCLNLSEVRLMARELCDITDKKELNTILFSLHIQRIVLYHHESDEPDPLIVLNLQQLADIFKGVITFEKSKEIPAPDGTWINEAWDVLRCKGQLSRQLLEHIWKELLKKEKRYTFKKLVSIMEKFLFICKLPSASPEAYLVPHMMRYDPSKRDSSSSNVPSLFVKFPGSPNPVDLFPHLIVCLIDEWNRRKWHNLELGDLSPKLYRDAAVLVSPLEKVALILLCHLTFVEILFNTSASPSEPKKMCPIVCTVLKQALEHLKSECFWLKAKSNLYVLCPVCCDGLKCRLCCNHKEPNCTKVECLHFYSEKELRTPQLRCLENTNSPTYTVKVEEISLWFSKVSVRCDIRDVLP